MLSDESRVNGLIRRKKPSILLVATVWWPLSARLAIRFVEYGCRVTALCPKDHPLRHIEGLDAIIPFRGLSSLASLQTAIRQAMPDIIVPCDDRVVWLLHELHARSLDLRPLIEASLGAASEFRLIEHRGPLLETGQSLGIRTPKTQGIATEQDVHNWFASGERSGVLKLDGTWGGEGVVIAHSEEEAIDAFRRFSQPVGIGAAFKRFLINCDPLSFWSRKRQAQPAIIMQQFIAGRPANAMLACWKGEVLATASVEVLASEGATGAAFLVRRIEHEEIAQAARLLATRLQLTGFCGLDFLLDEVSGQSYLIEMNPRCTQLGHLPFYKGCDLAGALCTKLTGEYCATKEVPVEDQVVAFFPQALEWRAKNPQRRGVYDDIPQGQPKLVRELTRTSWPERQWISRTYHWFRPPRKAEAVEFIEETWGEMSAPEHLATENEMDKVPMKIGHDDS